VYRSLPCPRSVSRAVLLSKLLQRKYLLHVGPSVATGEGAPVLLTSPGLRLSFFEQLRMDSMKKICPLDR
jgi:hypothetical protein